MHPSMKIEVLGWLLLAVLAHQMGNTSGAPLTSSTARPSRGDRTLPPTWDEIQNVKMGALVSEDVSSLRVIRDTASLSTHSAAERDSENQFGSTVLPLKRRRKMPRKKMHTDGSTRATSASSSSGMDADAGIAVHLSADDHYYYYYYFDSFVEGVTSPADFDEYSEREPPIDQDDSGDDSDDGEIMKLLKMTPEHEKEKMKS